VNVLLISALPHVRHWVLGAAKGNREPHWVLHEARHVEAGNGLLRARHDIDLVLVDLDTAGLGAVDVARVWSVRPGANIAVTRWLTTETDLVTCVRAGALGYFPKELSAGALACAMSIVAQGMLWCPNLRQQLEPGGIAY
jgi:DNA-binding NarL/FixJ family response regulator